MDSQALSHAGIYRVRVKGVLGRPIADWLGDLTITPVKNGETLLVGRFADQSALRGLLEQLWNLNLTILAVDKIEE